MDTNFYSISAPKNTLVESLEEFYQPIGWDSDDAVLASFNAAIYDEMDGQDMGSWLLDIPLGVTKLSSALNFAVGSIITPEKVRLYLNQVDTKGLSASSREAMAEAMAEAEYATSLYLTRRENLFITRAGKDFDVHWTTGPFSPGNKENHSYIASLETLGYDLPDTSPISIAAAPIVAHLGKVFGADFTQVRSLASPHKINLPLHSNVLAALGLPNVLPPNGLAELDTSLSTAFRRWFSLEVTLHASRRFTESNNWVGSRADNKYRDREIGPAQALSNMNFTVTPVMRMPFKFAQWATQSEVPKLSALMKFMGQWTTDVFVNHSSHNQTAYFPISNLNEVSDLKKKRNLYVQQSRGNADNMVTTLDGSLMWVPSVDMVGKEAALEYERQTEALVEKFGELGIPWNPGRKTIDLSGVVYDPNTDLTPLAEASAMLRTYQDLLTTLASVPLSVTWDLNKIVSIRDSGNESISDIGGAKAPSDASAFIALTDEPHYALPQLLSNQTYNGVPVEPETFVSSNFSHLDVHMQFGRFVGLAVGAGALKNFSVASYIEKAAKELKLTLPLDTKGPQSALLTIAKRYFAPLIVNSEGKFLGAPLSTAVEIQNTLLGIFKSPVPIGTTTGWADPAASEPSKKIAGWRSFITNAVEAEMFSRSVSEALHHYTSRTYYRFWASANDGEVSDEDDREFNPNEMSSATVTKDYAEASQRTLLGRAYAMMCSDVLDAFNSDKVWQLSEHSKWVNEGLSVIPDYKALTGSLAPWLHLWGRLMPQADAIVARINDNQAKAAAAKQNMTVPKFAVGTENSFALMRHQGQKMATLAHAPADDWSDISPGGGKGTITILDAIQLISEHNVQKALIICPNDLIVNYTSDVQRYAGANWNVFPLNTEVFNRWGADVLIEKIRTAPVNTLFIAGYGWLSKSAQTQVQIGDETVTLFAALEMLRQINWEAILIDEVHFLRNDSIVSRCVATLTLDPRVKFVRKLSGTLIMTRIEDIVHEARLTDPGIYGNVGAFRARFNPTGLNWTPKAIGEVKQRLSHSGSYFRATKKDWAYCLPRPMYKFIQIHASEEFLNVYNLVFSESVAELKAKAAKDPKFAKLLADMEDPANFEDESFNRKVEAALRTYLQRLEMFVVDPAGDPMSEIYPGLVSPIHAKIAELLEEHEARSNLKVIILTRYVRNAKAVFDNLPEKFKKQALTYRGGEKDKRILFETQKQYKILCAVEMSLANGFNLQLADYIIRVDNPWSPGEVEQSESRIFRPDIGNKYGRDTIDVATLVMTKTLQVTKMVRLIGRMVDKAKFDEYGNPRYDALPTLPLVRMSLENFQSYTNFADFPEFLDAYGDMVKIRGQEFNEALKEVGDDKSKFWVPIQGEPMPVGSLIVNMPLVIGGAAPDPFKHNIIPLAKYLDGIDDDNYTLVGQMVRAENGHGIITKESLGVDEFGVRFVKSVTIQYSDYVDESGNSTERFTGQSTGLVHIATDVPPSDEKLYRVQHKPLAIDPNNPRASLDFKGSKPLRTKAVVAEEVVDVIEKPKPAKTAPKPFQFTKTDKGEDQGLEVHIATINNMPTLYFYPEDDDYAKLKKLKGITMLADYVYSEARYVEEYRKTIAWLQKRFEIAPGNLEYLRSQEVLFDKGRKQRFNASLVGSGPSIYEFHRQARRVLSPPRIRVHVMIEADQLFLVIDVKQSPTARRLVNKTAPGLPERCRWSGADESYAVWVLPEGEPKSRINTYVNEIRKQGFKITNLEDLKDQWRQLKV